MRIFLSAATTSAALVYAVSAQAAPTPAPAPTYTAHDMQCFIAASEVADGSDDAEVKNNGMMAAMYYAGKLYGANPKIDFTAALDAETDKLASIDMQALLKECGAELEAHGSEIEEAGKILMAKGK